MKNLSFKRKKNVRPVQLESEDGTVKEYELRELKSLTRDKFLDRFTARLQTDSAGNVIGIKPGKYEGMQAELLTISLFEAGSETPVDKAFVDELPSVATGELYKAAQILNGLRKADEFNSLLAGRLAGWLAKEKGIVGVETEELEAFLDSAESSIKNSGDAKESEQGAS